MSKKRSRNKETLGDKVEEALSTLAQVYNTFINRYEYFPKKSMVRRHQCDICIHPNGGGQSLSLRLRDAAIHARDSADVMFEKIEKWLKKARKMARAVTSPAKWRRLAEAGVLTSEYPDDRNFVRPGRVFARPSVFD